VSKLLSTQKTNTASGPDGMSGQMLCGTAESISPSVTALFNLSLKQATFPDEWKVANMSPIPKPGDPSVAANYRPISVLSIISKLLESYHSLHITSSPTVTLASDPDPLHKKLSFQ